MKRQTQHITRFELHLRVWETPPEVLSEELGLELEALKKLCMERAIPRPREGYWRRKSAGLPVIKYRLPPLNKGASGDIVFGSAKRPGLHPVVAALLKWRAQQRKDRPQAKWVFTPCEGRRLSMMSRIFYGAERSNIRPNIGKLNIIEFRFGAAMIECRLREKLKKSESAVSEKEKSRLPEHLRHRNLLPTGRLAFEIDSRYVDPGTKREWIETPTCLFEKMLPEIIAAIRRAVLERVEFEKEAELRKVGERADARARWVKRDQQELEQRRWLELSKLAERYEAVDRVRRLLTILEAESWDPSQVFGDRTAGEWFVWLREQLEKRDPLCNGAAELIEVLSRIR